MKVSGNDHLEGARSLSRHLMQICIISGHFLGTLADMGPIQYTLGRCINLAVEHP